MKNKSLKTMVESKNFVISEVLIKALKNIDMTKDEFLLLIYFYNNQSETFNPENISKYLGIPTPKILSSINNLTLLDLIEFKLDKDSDGKMCETIKIDKLVDKINEEISHEEIEIDVLDDSNIFERFEMSFGRTLSQVEYEIINGWLTTGYNEDIISSALDEAIKNDVRNLRYIDKILYEWKKKGINKSPKEKTPEEDLFDYDWLDEN